MRSNRSRSLLTTITAIIIALAFTFANLGVDPDAYAHPVKTRRILPMRLGSARTPGASVEPAMQMPLVLPLFIQDRNFSSVLVLVNASGLSTYANVVVTGLDGREIKRERVNFSPHSQRRLEIYDLLQSAVSAATTGRITVVQSPDLKGMSIGAQLSMTYQASSDPNYIDEEAAMPSADGSQVLRGVADRAQGSPLIAISSLSEMSQQVLVECLGEIGRASCRERV